MKVKVNWFDEVSKWHGNNDGYIYGIYWMDGEEITHVEWYKTEWERDNNTIEVEQ